jgi:hypothetical protein
MENKLNLGSNLNLDVISIAPSFSMATQLISNSHASSIAAYNSVSNQYQSNMTMNAANIVNLMHLYKKT